MLTTFHNVTSHHVPIIIRTVFLNQRATACFARQFYWHVLSKQRSCPLITGFSSRRVWVTQPRHQLRRFGDKRFYQVSGEAHRLFHPYKGTRIHPFHVRLLPPSSSVLAHSSSSAQAFIFSAHKGLPKMSGSGAGGKWMASTVREKDIKKLREAGYLTKKISHRLPTAGQIVPTPEP